MNLRDLLSSTLLTVALPATAQAANPIVVAIAEPSTISLIGAGIIALGIARRKIDKSTKS